MQVILKQDVKHIGRRGEVVNASEGYARNFLFPRGLAEAATPEILKKITEKKYQEKESRAASSKRIAEILRILPDQKIAFAVKADGHGKAYGSINKEDILSALRREKWLGKERAEVILERPLKEIGEHEVLLRFPDGQTGKLKLVLHSQP